MATDALLSFNTIPGAANMVSVSGHTSSGNGIHGGVVIPGVQRSHALYVRIRYDVTTSAGSGPNTVQFSVQAYDPAPGIPGVSGSAGFYDHTVNANRVIAPTLATSQIGEMYLPITTDSKEIRLAYTIVGTVSASFIADLVNSNV